MSRLISQAVGASGELKSTWVVGGRLTTAEDDECRGGPDMTWRHGNVDKDVVI